MGERQATGSEIRASHASILISFSVHIAAVFVRSHTMVALLSGHVRGGPDHVYSNYPKGPGILPSGNSRVVELKKKKRVKPNTTTWLKEIEKGRVS